MKKTLVIALLALSTTLFGAAKETKILPIFTEGYCGEPTVALMVGTGKYKNATNNRATMYGIELGFACPVFQIKGLEINQVLSLVHSDKDGLETNTLEMNPRIMFELSDKMKFGFGPGLGVIFAKTNGQSDEIFGFNVGASLNYDISKDMFIGIESRYQWAGEADLSNGANVDMDNCRTLLKVGTRF